MQGVQFFAFLVLFLAYLFVAVYGSDPEWDTAQMLASSQGKAALALECILMLMMFGQVRWWSRFRASSGGEPGTHSHAQGRPSQARRLCVQGGSLVRPDSFLLPKYLCHNAVSW